MPLHLLFPLASSIVFVLGMLYAKQAISGGANPWTNTVASNVCLMICWGLIGVLRGEHLPLASWWQPALAGLAFVAGQLFTYLAYQFGDVSVATPIFGVKVVMVAALLAAVGDETVGVRVWTGAILAAVGVGIVQAGAGSKAGEHLTARHAVLTVALSLLAAFAFSLFDVSLQIWGRQLGSASFLPVVFVCSGIFSCGLLPWTDRPTKLMQLNVMRPLLIGSVLMAVQAMSMSYALGWYGDAARINIVYALRGLWAVALAWLLARSFGGAEARHSVATMLLRLLGAVLLTAAVVIALG